MLTGMKRFAQNVRYFKALILIDAQHIIVPKSKELIVAKLLLYINEIYELNKYFLTLKENKLTERDYM